MIYLSRIAIQQFDKEVTDEAIFVTEREVLLYMKVLMDEMTPAFQNEEGSNSQDRDLMQVTSEDNASDTSDAEPPRKKAKESASEYSSKKKNTQEKKTTHHKVVKCCLPKCNYFGGNLTRHLQTHVKKGEIRKSNIPRLSSVMSQGKKQRGPRKVDRAKKTTVAGRRKKWCPYQHCAKVVTYLSTHLRRKHGLIGLDELEADCSASSSEENTCSEEESQTPASPVAKAKIAAEKQSDKEEEEEGAESTSQSESENYSSSSEDSVAPSSKAYFEARKYDNARHKWLCGFFQYLATRKKTRACNIAAKCQYYWSTLSLMEPTSHVWARTMATQSGKGGCSQRWKTQPRRRAP